MSVAKLRAVLADLVELMQDGVRRGRMRTVDPADVEALAALDVSRLSDNPGLDGDDDPGDAPPPALDRRLRLRPRGPAVPAVRPPRAGRRPAGSPPVLVRLLSASTADRAGEPPPRRGQRVVARSVEAALAPRGVAPRPDAE